MFQINGKIPHVHVLKEVMLKCPNYLKQSLDLMQPFWKYPWPYRTRTKNAKICVEPQKANKQKQIAKGILRGKKEIKLKVSDSLTSHYSKATTIKTVCSVQSSSHVWLFATAAHQASLSITNSQSLLKLISIKSVMPSNHLIFCHPLPLLPSIFPSIRVFSKESVLYIRWPKYWSFNSASVLPMNIQDWFPLGWTGWISLQSKGLSRIFSNTTVQKHQFFSTQLSL